MRSIEDLFHALLQDVYFAERQWLRSLDEAIAAGANATMSRALTVHRLEVEERIGRLEQIFTLIGRRARGKHCDAVLGILAELNDVVARIAAGSVRDAGILAAAQAAAHYEIARYTTLLAWAQRLDERQSARLLRQSLDEAKAADALFGRIALASVNLAARAA